jgi:hypothetical protein
MVYPLVYHFIKWSFDAMKNRRGLLQLEGLTERIVPAVAIRAIDGDLVISGIHNTGTLTINVTGDNEVTINDGGTKNRGTYAVDGDLILNLSNRNDTVVINFTTDSRLDGSILANLGNGNDSFTINNSAGLDAGIFGSLVVDGGNGSDSVIIANTGAAQLLTIEGALNFNGGAGLDILSINGDNAGTGRATFPQPVSPITIGGGLTMTRVNTVNVADDASAATAIDVTIDNNTVFNASADKLIANTVVVGGTKGDVTIAGALTVTGGQGTDGFTLTNVLLVDVVPAEDTVAEVNFSLDKGANTLTFDGVEMGIEGTDVDFVYVGGVGADKIAWATGDNTFSGDVTITLGKGNNEVDIDLGAGVATGVPVVAGNLTITGGDNTDNIDLNDTTVFGLSTFTLGNGTNDLDSSGDFDGGLSYVGGNGIDTVLLSNGDGLAGDVSISLGANDDRVVISNTTVVSATSLTIDFGVGGIDDVTFDTIFLDLVTLLNIGSGDTYTT